MALDRLEAYDLVSPEHLEVEASKDHEYLDRLFGLVYSPRRPMLVEELEAARDSLEDYLAGVRRTSIALGASGAVLQNRITEPKVT